MKGILDADSMLMSSLRRLWDYMGLNMCFLLCCIPIVTIGSAHSAMYTAIRALGRDEPWLKLFFRTFFHSFKRPTIMWLIMALLIGVFAWNTMALASVGDEASKVPMIVSAVVLGLAMCVCSTGLLLYSKFECTVGQLLRNSLLTVIMHPVRCVLGTALVWLPFIVLAVPLFAWLFAETIIYQVLVYYSFASFVFYWLMRKPFAKMAGEEIPEKKKKKKKGEEAEEEEADEAEVSDGSF